MDTICYECYETGKITEKTRTIAAQFATVKKYHVLYAEELPGFQKQPLHVYALPFGDTPSKIYNGTGRMGLNLFDPYKTLLSKEQKELKKSIFNDASFPDTLMASEDTSLQYISLFKKADNFELIWVRNSGDNTEVPCGYDFIGYDISYPCDYSGSFSMICDCMFICRWHGCDREGTLFSTDFSKLNRNGLFNDWKAAYDYMVKYLNEDWTERGEYCILEIFKRHGQEEL